MPTTNWPLCLYSKLKRLKLRFNVPSFQLFHRFKHSRSSSHGNPRPNSLRIVKLKASENKYLNHPAPPPSTPEQDISSSQVISLDYSGRSALLSGSRSFPYGSPVQVFITSNNSPKYVSKAKEWNGYKIRKSNEKRIHDEKVKVVKSQRELERQARNRAESFAVVKNSKDPCEDFRISMVEMILEKEMFGDKELEDLLHCFLSLNSRHYHPIIVQAFTDVWEMLFCEAYL